jgi:hypothetical protein
MNEDNVIEFPLEPPDPCLCCHSVYGVRHSIRLYLDGEKNPPRSFMLCGKCAAQHAAECLDFVEEMMRTEQLVEKDEEQ